MKVVQILYSGLGGHGSVAFALRNAARAIGAWSDALVFVGIEPVLEEYACACRATDIPYAYARAVPGRPWATWPAVYRALERCRPDAIVLHSVKTILPCALYARRHGVTLVAVEHQANALKKRAERWVSRLVMHLADKVVLLTDDYRDELQRALGRAWRGDKVHVIPNGVDTELFAPCRRQPQGRRPRVVGMAARFSNNKRQDLLVEAIGLLRQQDGPNRWHLSLAGDGETRAQVSARVTALRLEDAVSLPGFIGAEGLRDWFGGLDIYAHASEGETLSTSLLQALAMGLPVIGSDVPGITNLLTRGATAGLVVPQTAEGFAAALRRLATDGPLAGELSQRGRQRALAEYSRAAMFERYNELLQLCAK